MSELSRSKNEAGDTIMHPHEALQSIAVEMHQHTKLLAAILARMEKPNLEAASQLQREGMESVQALLAPIFNMASQKIQAQKAEPEPSPILPAEPTAHHAATVVSKTARTTQGPIHERLIS